MDEGRATESRPSEDGAGGDGHEPMVNVPPVTLGFFVVIAIAFAAVQLDPGGVGHWLFAHLGLLPGRVADIARTAPLSLDMGLALVPLVSHALLHFGWLHFGINVGFLLAFGSPTERAYGPWRFGLLLVVSAVTGGLAELAVNWGTNTILLGASGAVWGCFAGVVRLMWAHPDPRRRALGWRLLATLSVLNLVFGLGGGYLLGGGANIAWLAHFGGFAGGLAVAWRLPPWNLPRGRIRRKSRTDGLT